MKKILYVALLGFAVYSCKPTQGTSEQNHPILARLDLVNVTNDKVMVMVDPAKITTDEITFHVPKTVPGTYSTDNYGQFVEGLKAMDYKGNTLLVTRTDDNSWKISNAKALDKVTYWVNDTYDIDGEKGVFSPAGSNIDKGKNFVLNMHCFVGYFEGMAEQPYKILITHPKSLIAGTSLKKIEVPSKEASATDVTDEFSVPRYFEVTDHPIMYAAPDTVSFQLNGMRVLLDMYSPNHTYTVADIEPGLKKMMTAQKNFMGAINNTNSYAIQVYLADLQKEDAKGFGALEHHTSTTVVLPESMTLEELNNTLTDVVSHEFFHTITPLSIHSKEIHYFDYNNPKMSEHLWMYEGVTEYFANLFQVNQGLIDNQAFYDRMAAKIETSKSFDDTVPFTVMSKHILEDEYKDSYYNVYQKGALIGMCLDIRLRELSDGKMGILDLMKKLSEKYGKNNPFDDAELIPTIVSLTSPEIQEFFDTYVTGSTPIPYRKFLAKVGVDISTTQIPTQYFINGQTPYIDGNPETNELFFREGISFNSFLDELGVKGGDVIKTVNGTAYGVTNVYPLIIASQSWKPGDTVTFVVERNGEEITLSAKAEQPMAEKTTLKEIDLPANDKLVQLRKAWLKG